MFDNSEANQLSLGIQLKIKLSTLHLTFLQIQHSVCLSEITDEVPVTYLCFLRQVIVNWFIYINIICNDD